MSLRASLATPEGKRRYVRRLFTTIADRYDLITVLLSYGQDRRWKRRVIHFANMRPNGLVLDLACGTGDITLALAKSGNRVIGVDVTPRMIEIARLRRGREHQTSAQFVVGDMMGLPFRSESVATITIGYGIRNVPVVRQAIEEMYRVLGPGGRLISLDFGRPENRLFRGIYLSYLTVVGSILGWVLHRDPDTYRYIPESIRSYAGPRGIMAMLRECGFREARVEPILGGLMAINTARK